MASHIWGQNGDKNGFKPHQVAVVMIPLPAQGHLNPLLHLAHLIATHQIPVHYVSSATHNHQAKLRAHGLDHPPQNNSKNNIHFHDLQFLPLSSPPTKLVNTTTKTPLHLLLIFKTCYLLRNPVNHLLQSLSSKFKRIVVIHDSLMASVVQDFKFIPNAESYTFHTSSAFAIFFTIWESLVEKPFKLGCDIPKVIPSCEDWNCPEFEKFIANQYKLLNLSSGRLYNTCRSLEGRYIDLLKKLPVNENKKLYAIGPMSPLIRSTQSGSKKNHHKCLDWLDQQEQGSVMYVSFGTTVSMKEEEIRELAMGLERSEQKFIWIFRGADKVDIFEENGVKRDGDNKLPKGYEERVRNRGILVRDWAPQVEILGHPSIGGFLSHCGWNSCIESLSMGVPIATWPMHFDQPKNSVLVTEVLRVGLVVRDWAHYDGVVKASVVESVVKRLMASKEGKEIRKRAQELGVKIRGSTSRGGASSMEMASFVAHITR